MENTHTEGTGIEKMGKIAITDLTLRDAHQSLLATRMLTSDMLPVAPRMDAAGFWSLEVWGGATFDSCIRFLNEDPWERLRALRAAIPSTRLQMLLRGQNLLGYRHYADDVVEAFVAHAATCGIDVFRVFDALNDPRNLATAMRAVKKAGKHSQAAISYAVSPVHTIESYVELAAAMRDMGADSICVKDMAGLLTPFAAAELVAGIKRRTELPVCVHSHATTGMSVATLLKAAEAGADILDTVISSMSMGTSHSPTEALVEMLRGTPLDTGLDVKSLNEVAAYFRDVRKKYRAYESSFLGADARILVSQVPGGMLSNLESQLREQNALDRIDAVLEEIAVVQRDFGYPPLVTPTSQIVGTQAVVNVLMGRYKQLTTESRNLLAGLYGATPAKPSGELVRQALKELGRDQPVTARPADSIPAEMSKLEGDLRRETGNANPSAEDVLTYAMFPQVALKFFSERSKGPAAIQAPRENEAPAAQPQSGRMSLAVDGTLYDVTCEDTSGDSVKITVAGRPYTVKFSPASEGATEKQPAPGPDAESVLAPMPGTVIKLLKSDGDTVLENEGILVLEALKMQMEIRSRSAGRIRFAVRVNEHVKAQALLAEVS